MQTDPAPVIADYSRKRGGLRGLRVTLLGLGRFGGQIAAARFFAERGALVTVSDRAPADALSEGLRALGDLPIRWSLGAEDPGVLEGADLVCISPAIPRRSPLFHRVVVSRTPWTSELALGLCLLRGRAALVTGSNGKTTTATMLARAAASGGRTVHLVGNIGRSLLAAAAEIGPEDLTILEVSSFQLADLSRVRVRWPDVAIVTQITPNHLDRHRRFDRYVRLKIQAVARLLASGTAVVPAASPWTPRLLAATPARVVEVSAEESDAGPLPQRGGRLHVQAGAVVWTQAGRVGARRIGEAALSRLSGRHNLQNALAATAAAKALGASWEAALEAALRCPALPHRMETVATLGGVTYINDSKATTQEAAAAAIQAFEGGRLHWLGGGASKGAGFELVRRALLRVNGHAVVFGRAAGLLEAAIDPLRTGVRLNRAPDLAAAFVLAQAAAKRGDVVLLSPACTSYDAYRSYEERGAHFRALVLGAAPAARSSRQTRRSVGEPPHRARR